MQKQGYISITFFRENHSQLYSYEVNALLGHSLGQCQKYNFALHNQFWGEPRFFYLIFLNWCLKSQLWFAFVDPRFGTGMGGGLGWVGEDGLKGTR